MFAPVLADGFVTLVIIIVITVLGWLIKLGEQKNRKTPPARAARPRQQRDERLQNEIDSFLREVGGGKQPPRRNAPEEIPIEIVEEPARPVPQQTPRSFSELQGREREFQREGEKFGTGVRQHLQAYMSDERFRQQVEQDLGHHVDDSVAAHLGKFTGDDAQEAEEARRLANAPARRIFEMLHSPDGVRRAVLINEILSPPRGLRRR